MNICQTGLTGRILVPSPLLSFLRYSHSDVNVKAPLDPAFKRSSNPVPGRSTTRKPVYSPKYLHIPSFLKRAHRHHLHKQRLSERSISEAISATPASSSSVSRDSDEKLRLLSKLQNMLSDDERTAITLVPRIDPSASSQNNAEGQLDTSTKPQSSLSSSADAEDTEQAEIALQNSKSHSRYKKRHRKAERKKVELSKQLASEELSAGSEPNAIPTTQRKGIRKSTNNGKGRDLDNGRKQNGDARGVDELAPPFRQERTGDLSLRSDTEPTVKGLPAYTRRIEGLLLPMGDQEVILEDVPPPSESLPIANLAHGLDRVLFNPGVHWLQDPRSRVYNFTPSLQSLPDVREFAFERLGGFIKSSRDEDLYSLAATHRRRFVGSTSSLTGMLSHIYFLISNDHNVDTSTLSKSFAFEPKNFTPGQRMPACLAFRHRNGMYAIDSENPEDSQEKNILSWLGTMLEKLLTLPTEEFAPLLRSSTGSANPEQKKEAYRYAKTDTFVMRSQLDCQDPRLPGTGVFDIKTRGVLPIRLDGLNYKENSGYLIRNLQGSLESFEKEYYDLIRSAFLKYSFQARIGNMDGIFLAYHNTARIFGFQYVPLEDMDERIFGSKDRGERVFHKCIGMLEAVVEEVVAIFPRKSINCTFETPEGRGVMHVWIQSSEEFEGEDTAPIAQLNVSTTSYLGNKRVKGYQAVDGVDSPWTLHWSISRSSQPEEKIRANLKAAHERLFRVYNIPSGSSVKEMIQKWDAINFGADPSRASTQEMGESTVNSKHFKKPGKNIKKLRLLAREGQMDVQKWAEEEKGRQKIVWGQPDFAEVIEEKELMDQLPMEDTAADLSGDAVFVAPGAQSVDRTPDESMDKLKINRTPSSSVKTQSDAREESLRLSPKDSTIRISTASSSKTNPEQATSNATEDFGHNR